MKTILKAIGLYLVIGIVIVAFEYFTADESKRRDMGMWAPMLPFAVVLWPKIIMNRFLK